MNKKAVFFSLASVLVVLLFYLASRIAYEAQVEMTEMELTRSRVEILNYVVTDFEGRYFERMLYVASKSALDQISIRAANGYNVFDLEGDFGSCVLWGNLSTSSTIISDKSIDKQLKTLRDKMLGIGMVIQELTVSDVTITQDDPWEVHVGAKISYNFKDLYNISSWKGETYKEVDVSLIGLTDPLHKIPIRIDATSDSSFRVDTWEPQDPLICAPDTSTYDLGCNPYREPSYLNKLKGKGRYDLKVEDYGLGICPYAETMDPIIGLGGCNKK